MRTKVALALVLVSCALSADERTAAERFYQAIRNNDLTTLGQLVTELGAKTKDGLGQTPLMLATAFGSAEAMEVLIVGGAEVNAASNSGVTALHWSRGDAQKVRLLLNHGADVAARTQLGRTPLLTAASSNGAAEAVRLLLEKGADVNAADNVGITPLIASNSVDDPAVATLLLARNPDINATANGAPSSATALTAAAYNGNVGLVRVLLARGSRLETISTDKAGIVKNGPIQFGNVRALHTAATSGDTDVVKLLLDAGATIDPKDVRGMTPLIWSVATDRPQPALVRMLLQKGADRSLRSNDGESTVDWARKFNNPAVLAELGLEPVKTPSVTAETGGRIQSVAARQAVERSMPLLRTGSTRMLTMGGCVACHAQALSAMSQSLARARGWNVEPPESELRQVVASMTAAIPALLQGREAGGLPDTQAYNTMMLATLDAPANQSTDAFVHYLAAKQRQEGNWHGIGATRAPIQDGDFSRTAMAIRTLAVYGTPARRAELTERIERAARWLAAQTPLTTEDRVMQLLGLKWAKANDEVRKTRTKELVTLQRADGGWAQTPYLSSDAYATGQAMYTLAEMSVPSTDPAVQRGAAFLLRTQGGDGTWFVKSRAMKIQPYFEGGFPHGHDQWISQSATAWAAMALAKGTE